MNVVRKYAVCYPGETYCGNCEKLCKTKSGLQCACLIVDKPDDLRGRLDFTFCDDHCKNSALAGLQAHVNVGIGLAVGSVMAVACALLLLYTMYQWYYTDMTDPMEFGGNRIGPSCNRSCPVHCPQAAFPVGDCETACCEHCTSVINVTGNAAVISVSASINDVIHISVGATAAHIDTTANATITDAFDTDADTINTDTINTDDALVAITCKSDDDVIVLRASADLTANAISDRSDDNLTASAVNDTSDDDNHIIISDSDNDIVIISAKEDFTTTVYVDVKAKHNQL